MVKLPPAFAKAGEVVVAKPEALALVAYLLALDRTYPALPPVPKAANSAEAAKQKR